MFTFTDLIISVNNNTICPLRKTYLSNGKKNNMYNLNFLKSSKVINGLMRPVEETGYYA